MLGPRLFLPVQEVANLKSAASTETRRLIVKLSRLGSSCVLRGQKGDDHRGGVANNSFERFPSWNGRGWFDLRC